SSGAGVSVNIHADEINELMGDEFIPMINKAGGAGFQVTAYTQTVSDIVVKLGDEAKAGQAIGNFGTVIMLRVKEVATAELLTSQLPMVEVSASTEVTGAGDSVDLDSDVDFTSNSQDRIQWTPSEMLHPSSIMSLPKGQAFILTTGGTLWKVRIPLPDSKQDLYLADKFSQMAADMEESYRTSENWWVD
ncbi:MAG: TraM recognition domain-containing protein, partial [Gammaproteobacteria bacterium]|nr:TraM recognition domain-containing protein [Gammaproteobacteria bacterium]